MLEEKTNIKKAENGFKKILPQLLAVGAKNLLLLGYGMTLGFPTIAIPSLKGDPSRPGIEDELVLSKEQISWIGSINLIAVPLGCLLSGVTTQPIGRKKSMQFINIPFIISWLLFHYAKRVELLYLALVITGFSGGILEAPVLTYVAEITQPYLRGMLSATSSMSIILGIFIQFLFGTFLNWRTVALINIVFPITAIICLFFIPESPHWLISKKRYHDAKQSLQWLRGWCSESEILNEYNEIYSSIHKNQPDGKVVKTSKLKNYTKRNFIEPYFLVCLTFFLGHFSGMTTLQTYAVEIFDTLKAPIDKYYATLILGIVELLGTLVCVILVHYIGKRVLTFTSTLGCACCFLIVGTYAFLIDSVHPDEHTWVPTTFLILSAFLSHIGIRLLPWILIGEVFPNETRANASGLSGGAGYVFGFLANKLFFTMIYTLSWPGTFWWYGITGLIGTVVLYFMLPETEGKPLAEIGLHFTGEKRLRKSVRRGKRKEYKSDNGNKVGVIGMPVKEILESEAIESRL